METINDFKADDIIKHHRRGDGRVLSVTPRTITVKWKHSTQKITFSKNNAHLDVCDF
jgi:hypothetical protein